MKAYEDLNRVYAPKIDDVLNDVKNKPMSEKDFKGFCEYYERIEPKTLGALLEDYNNSDVKVFLTACQNVQNRYLDMADYQSLPGISNLFGISQPIKKRFNTGFSVLYLPGDPRISRCDNCAQAKIKRNGCMNCSKTKDSCNIHFKNKSYTKPICG